MPIFSLLKSKPSARGGDGSMMDVMSPVNSSQVTTIECMQNAIPVVYDKQLLGPRGGRSCVCCALKSTGHLPPPHTHTKKHHPSYQQCDIVTCTRPHAARKLLHSTSLRLYGIGSFSFAAAGRYFQLTFLLVTAATDLLLFFTTFTVLCCCPCAHLSVVLASCIWDGV